ncbi:MAG: phosphate signaling complex protein PhoU [Bacteroidales bacterium]|jgi:phosphate transport system protein|nr:phosphate signaling complex protein PhoU [Bacteroidales bacterium]
MKHTEKELQQLKDSLIQMWHLVLSQLEKTEQAFLEHTPELAREVIHKEKRVDAFELKMDADVENFIALYAPVAIDLRLVLSIMKISSSLERIGDFCESISEYVLKNTLIEDDLLDKLKFNSLFSESFGMLSDCLKCFENEDISIAGKVILQDDLIDEIYRNSFELLKQNVTDLSNSLALVIFLRKLERIGDHCSNIMEEIVFYMDAKVLKHKYHN